MTLMSTADIQKALTVAHTQDPLHVTGPGTIDGLWGPNTQSSFDSWVAVQSADVIGGAGILLTQPARRSTSVDLPAPIAAVLQTLSAIYGLQPGYGGSPSQVAPGVQQAQAAATAAQAAAARTAATTPAQRAAASAAISPPSGRNPLLPSLPTSSVMMPLPLQAQSTGPLGIDWWIWGLVGVGAVATAGGLYWYYTHGKKHRVRHHR